MQRNRNQATGDLCRRSAVAVTLLSFPVCHCLHVLTPGIAAGRLAAGCAILTVAPSSDKEACLPRSWILFQSVFALAAVLLAGWLGAGFAPMIDLFLVLGPPLAAMVRNNLVLTGKQEFLSTDLPGWEYMLALSRKTFLCIQIFLLAAAWTGTVSGGVPGLVMQLLSLGGLALLLAVLLIRSVTSQSLLSSRFESGVIARIKDASFLRPSPAARLSIPSRMVFERICEYMETAQPFLDETFSLDDLARNIYTNKSYVSKVINVCTSMNFPQFLNNYRVRYAMELFRRDPKLRVTELSAMSGFHSTVTFNLAFRLFLNQTPGNWCREYRERIEREKQAPSMKQGPVP